MTNNVELMNLVTNEDPELVVAVVAPVGADLEDFERRFRDLVAQFKYKTSTIKLSDIAKQINVDHFGLNVDESDPFNRIDSLMSLGNEVRARAKRGDVLALHAIARIAESRAHGLTREFGPEPLRRHIHLLKSLKHPHEVEALRRVYGPGFFLIGVNTDPQERLTNLTGWKGMTTEQAQHLFKRDENEEDPFGQKTRDTFALADVFVSSKGYIDQLARFLELIFDAPFLTPTHEEYSMFLAYAASLRSAQMARQVGAVVVSADGEVIATGVNEVPRAGGGQYWHGGPEDHRDHCRGGDSNDEAIDEIVEEIIKAVKQCDKNANVEGLSDRLRRGTTIGDLTEFGRVVHAEMEALLACARAGVSPRGGTLFCTTFPCHNCAKHIIAAGLRKVVYVEPYPKSRATRHHEDAITLVESGDDPRVLFTPFVGIGARRYFDLFSMRLGAGTPLVRKSGGKPRIWDRPTAKPRLRMSPFGYMRREQLVVDLLKEVFATLEKSGPTDPENPARQS